jgi:phosphonopyruvate decarboxylase
LLEDLGIPYREVVDDEAQIDDICTWAAHEAAKISAPVALLSKKGIMEKGKGEQEYPNPLDLSICREDAIELVIDSFSGDTVFVATTGRASRELFDIRRKRNESHERDFLNIGATGHASQIALGLAIGQPNRRVICLDGDGAALMHLGGLAINAQSAGANYVHLIINNGVHESVGGQPSIGHSIDFTTMARAFGYKTLAGPVSNKADLLAGLQFAHDTDRPFFIDVHIKQGIRNDIPKLVFDEKTAKNSLMYNLNLGLLDNE